MSTFFDRINWPALREQKAALIDQIAYDCADAEALNGIVNLIDAMQDHAVDALGIPENVVFDKTDD